MRTALTMFGIAWVIISITLMVAAGEGLRVGQQRQTENLGKDIMIVFAGRTSLQAGGTRAGRPVRWKSADHEAVAREAWGCRYVLPELGRDGTSVRSAHNSGALLVTGSLPPFAEVRSIAVGEGRFYNWEDQRAARRVAFLGSDARKQLFGAGEAVGQTVRIGDFPYTVIGVMKFKEQDSSYDGRDVNKVFVPISAMLRDFPEKPPSAADDIDQLLVTSRGFEHHETCKAQLRRALGRLHGFDARDEEAAFIWDTVENLRAFHTLTDGMKLFLGGVGVVTLFLGGIGVMNVMLVAVRERTREIGVRKAVGATANSILWQFFAEASLVVLSSGAAGMAVAHGFCLLLNRLPMPPFFAGMIPGWESGLISFAVLGLVAVLSAIYPAGLAAAVDPIEALRFEAGG